ncbi:MAG: efflux RND transporter periplasmic adaptor subunit [Betaproteobacteria bacterium]|nr:efflux RND transporter periplasmic adaptor subunit [Betaproteobacteria bacterium]
MNPTLRFVAPTLLSLAVLAACSPGGGTPAAGGPAGMPPTEVDVITVKSGNALLTQDQPGRLQAYRSAQVRARVEGIVEKRLFTEGSDVKEGATLFQIDARNYAAAVEAAAADVDASKLVVERYKPLLEIRGVSVQEYDAARAKLKQAQATLTRAQIDLDNTRVPAPLSGRIGRALVTEGALVGRGEVTPLALIEQIDPVYANFTQPGADLLRLQHAVKSGRWKRADSARVELILEDGSVYALPGKLLFSDLAVDSTTGAVSLRAEFPNPRHEILPGMFVRVRFPEAIAVDSLRVPQRAVQTGANGQYVLVVGAGSKVEIRPVRSAGMAGGDFIIADGLAAGDQVIVNGQQKVQPGATVKPVAWNPVAAPATAPPPAPAGNAKKEG